MFKASVLAGFLLSSCALIGTAHAAEKCKIGISVYTLNSRFMAALQKAAIEKVKAEGCAVVATDAQNGLMKQVSDIEDMQSANITGLIVDPYNATGLIPTVNAVTKSGIPVVVMDNTVDPSANFLTMVQSSNIQNGTMVGHWVAAYMKGIPMKIALISGQQGSGAGQERRDGLFDGIIEEQLQTQGYTNFQVVAQHYTDWTADQGLSAMEDILQAHPDVNVVLSEADVMNFGAMKALAEKGKKGVLIAAAADAQKEALAMIAAGTYGATGLNSPTLIADTAADIAVKAATHQLKEAPPKLVLTKAIAITKANVAQYYDSNSVF